MSDKRQVAAIIQARMGSTRLPGKALRPIAGQPLIWHIVHRLRKSRLIDSFCLATTVEAADDPLAAWGEANGLTVVRGSVDDVLGRFAQAAEVLGQPDVIVRVNADAPLIDARFVDHLIGELIRHDADFVMLKPGTPCIHDGVDPFSRRGLEILMTTARHDPIAREHVTAWFKQNRESIRVADIEIDPAYQFSGARVSVDTPADAQFIETVYERLHAQAGEASLTDLVALLRRDASLLSINAHVAQKSVTQSSGTVLIRCDAGAGTGFGHVMRCLAVADHLRDRHGFGAVFAMREDEKAQTLVRGRGHAVEVWPQDCDEENWVSGLIARLNPRALVLDIRTALPRAAVARFRRCVQPVVVIDDASERRLAADIAIYPPVKRACALDWAGAAGRALVGWEWTPMGQDGAVPPRASVADREVPRILVTMGGSDPEGLTFAAARAVALLRPHAQAVVVIGPSFAEPDALVARLAALKADIEIARNPADMLELMASCDLAVAAFGVSAYELASVGVPALYLCLTEDHAASAAAFVDAGMGESLGIAARISAMDVAGALDRLMHDPERRRAMSAAGRLNVDGRGAERVAGEIARLVEAGASTLSAAAR